MFASGSKRAIATPVGRLSIRNFCCTNQVGGYAGERSREIVEALEFGVGKRDLIENEHDLLAGVEACRKLYAFVYAEREAVGIIAGVLLAPKGEVIEAQP